MLSLSFWAIVFQLKRNFKHMMFWSAALLSISFYSTSNNVPADCIPFQT